MRASLPYWLVTGTALVLAWACGEPHAEPPPACSDGDDGCPCYQNGSCNGALECRASVCVDINRLAEGGSSPGPSGGSGGAVSSGQGGALAQGGASEGGASSKGGASQGGSGGGALPSTGGVAGSAVGGVGGAAGGASSGQAGSDPGSTGGVGGMAGAGSGGGGASGGNAPEGGGPPVTGGSAATGGSAPTGGAGPGGVLFSDDFEDGDPSEWAAESWELALEEDNYLLHQNPDYDGTTVVAEAGSEDWTDRRMEVSFRFGAEGTVVFAALTSHLVFGDDRIQVTMGTSGAGTLLHSNAGVLTARQFAAPISIGTWYRLALEVEGTTVRAYFDGAMLAEIENLGGIPGGVGLSATQVGDVYFDDVLVLAP